MAKKIIDRLKVRELHDKGAKVIEIAKEMGCTKGAVSKILKSMDLEIAKEAASAAPQYVEKKGAATDHLLFLVNKAKDELNWIEKTVPPKNTADYREWQNQKLKFAAEMRKLISAIGDIGFKLFKAEEMNEILNIFDQEIGYESEELQKRIRERIARRRAIRFPAGLN